MRGAPPEAVAAAPEAEAMPQPAPLPARREFGRPATKSAPPPAIARDEPARTAVAAPRRAAAGLPDRLHMALIRASGINPNAPEMAAIIAQWPTSAELRSNPAAKRALWPRLRALRRQVRG
ncbi:MAG: alanine acetyltransferase [Pseudoxanthomonas sp.]